MEKAVVRTSEISTNECCLTRTCMSDVSSFNEKEDNGRQRCYICGIFRNVFQEFQCLLTSHFQKLLHLLNVLRRNLAPLITNSRIHTYVLEQLWNKVPLCMESRALHLWKWHPWIGPSASGFQQACDNNKTKMLKHDVLHPVLVGWRNEVKCNKSESTQWHRKWNCSHVVPNTHLLGDGVWPENALDLVVVVV